MTRARSGEPRAPRERRRAGASPASFAVLGFLAALGCLQLLIMIGVELNRTVEHQQALSELRADVRALEREAEGLRAIVEHGGDGAFREQLARRQGFVWPQEERLVVIPAEER